MLKVALFALCLALGQCAPQRFAAEQPSRAQPDPRYQAQPDPRYQGPPPQQDPRYQQQPPQRGPAPQQQQPPQQPQYQGPPPPNQQGPPQQGPPQQQRGPPPAPQINWGSCPQLEPTMEEKMKKATVITKCLELTPIPANITRETVEVHREQVAACALQMEGWFNDAGHYRFSKAESEIKGKKLAAQVESDVLKYHGQCKTEAEEKFPAASKQLIAQIQLYQACMDYFISEVCGIQVGLPQGSPPPQQRGPPPQRQQQQQPPRQYQ